MPPAAKGPRRPAVKRGGSRRGGNAAGTETNERWAEEARAVRAIQVAFDVSEEVQRVIRKEALYANLNPSDRVREILGLTVNGKPKRPRLSISLTPQDFEVLAERFGLDPEDRVAVRQRAAEALIEHVAGTQTQDDDT